MRRMDSIRSTRRAGARLPRAPVALPSGRALARAACIVAAIAAAGGCAKRFPPLPTYETLRTDPEYLRLRVELARFDASAVRRKRIVLDPGHGGTFPGMIGKKGTHEADVNLAVSLYLWGFLTDAGAEVLVTRTEDRDFLKPGEKETRPDLAERVRIANDFRPDLFVSLHHNADPNVNRKTNRTETYFKLTDPGPSLDVAQRIHRRLVEALGIPENRLLPGNYFVLRRTEAAAVLGEAAHLSHPPMEKRYRNPATAAREAAGYFKGIADYFRDGVPDVKDASPQNVTVATATPLIAAHIADDRGNAIDPLTVELTLDDAPVSSFFDPAEGLVTYAPPAPIANGEHRAELRARNVRGNATPSRAWRFRTDSPPARVLLAVAPDTMPAPGPLAVTAIVLDAHGQPVADSTEVAWTIGSAALVAADGPPPAKAIPPAATRTRAGTTTLYLEHAAGHAIGARAGAASAEAAIGREGAAGASGFCVDARDGRAVPLASVAAAGARRLANRDGWFAVADAAETLRVLAPGYRETRTPAAPRIALEPVAGGVLHGVRIVVDPEGGGDENGGLGPTSLRAADVNLRVALALAALLESAGARVHLTREADVPVSALARILDSERFAPQRFVRIGHRALGAKQPPVSVGHYPGSRDGARLAADLAAALGPGARVVEDVQFVIQQTSAAAVFVNLASIADAATERHLLSATELRLEAYTLYQGLLAHFGAPAGAAVAGTLPAAAERAPSDAVVTLDGYLSLSPDADGSFRFERVERGAHRIEAAYAGGPRWERAFEAESTAVRVEFGLAESSAPDQN